MVGKIIARRRLIFLSFVQYLRLPCLEIAASFVIRKEMACIWPTLRTYCSCRSYPVWAGARLRRSGWPRRSLLSKFRKIHRNIVTDVAVTIISSLHIARVAAITIARTTIPCELLSFTSVHSKRIFNGGFTTRHYRNRQLFSTLLSTILYRKYGAQNSPHFLTVVY